MKSKMTMVCGGKTPMWMIIYGRISMSGAHLVKKTAAFKQDGLIG